MSIASRINNTTAVIPPKEILLGRSCSISVEGDQYHGVIIDIEDDEILVLNLEGGSDKARFDMYNVVTLND